MRFYIGGPRVLGIRTGISIGPEDFANPAKPHPSIARWVHLVCGLWTLVVWWAGYAAISHLPLEKSPYRPDPEAIAVVAFIVPLLMWRAFIWIIRKLGL